MTFGHLLAASRRKRGHTQAQAGAAIGVTPPTISRWESGADTPTHKHITELAKYLGITEAKVLSAVHRQVSAPESDARLEAVITELRDEIAELREMVERLT